MSFIAKSVFSVLAVASLSIGFVCDQYYRAHSAEVLVLEGNSRTTLTVKSQVPIAPTGTSVKFNAFPVFGPAYDTILTEFQSTCNSPKLQQVVLHTRDSSEPFDSVSTTLWTQFAPQVNFGGTIKTNVFLIKNDSAGTSRDVPQMVGNQFTNMYGAYSLIDTIKTATGSDSALRKSFLGVQSVFDSTNFYTLHNAALTQPLPTPNTVRTLTIHFLTIYYDSTEVPNSSVGHAVSKNQFQVRFAGNKALIQLPESQKSGTLKIYSITGKIIRELRSSTNLFTWDGTSERGEEVPRGLYLAESESGFMGKIMYSRSSR